MAGGAQNAVLRIGDKAAGAVTRGILGLLRLMSYRTSGAVVSAVMRTLGPLFKQHRIARANLKLAFPEKPDAEIEAILRGSWDNLGRTVGEIAHLDRIKVRDPLDPNDHDWDISYDDASLKRFARLREDGKPALLFAAHLANWELPAIVAKAAGLDTVLLYRRPSVGAVADAVIAIRAGSMGRLQPTGVGAPVALAAAIEDGLHVGMLVDQYYERGPTVTFFGQPTQANSLIVRLARQVKDCPIHGTRIVRQPDGHFMAELTEAITPVRDANGDIDADGTMQVIMSVIEGWVREHPDQWLWQHRRWRGAAKPKRAR